MLSSSESMSIVLYFVTALTVVWLINILTKKTSVLKKIKGPTGVPILGNGHQLNPGYIVHQKVTDWSKTYGPMYRINLMGIDIIIVTGLKEIYEVLVSKGRDFAGRHDRYRIDHMMENKSDMLSLDYGPDNIYRRKLLHGHLKQYGEGIDKIESVTRVIVRKMTDGFLAQENEALDIQGALQNATIDITCVLVLGEVLEERAGEKAGDKSCTVYG